MIGAGGVAVWVGESMTGTRLGESPAADEIRATYQQRLGERSSERDRWRAWDRRLADLRLAVFLGALVAVYGLYLGSEWAGTGLGAALLVFAGMVVAHDPIRRRADRARRAVELYERGLVRIEGRWAGTGVSGEEFLTHEHPYAADLDLFGRGSIFERLCTARTRSGEAVLASWLLAPADTTTIAERHEAVEELRPRLDLREDLEVLGSDVRAGIDPEELSTWCGAPRTLRGIAIPMASVALAMVGTAAAIGWLFFETSLRPLLYVAIVDTIYGVTIGRRVRAALGDVDRHGADLRLLADLLERMEREPFHSPMLSRLRVAMDVEGTPASARLRRLARLLDLLQSRQNQFFAPIAALWHWTPLLAVRVDAWREESGSHVARWIRAIGEVEAIGAIAAYAAENPDDPLPTVVDGPARFESDGIGHPLIPARVCVRNEIELGDPTHLLIVSGSNMSGKSTMLRTVGINAVLAMAGAPVRARRLVLTPMAVGATLRIQDSLQEGRSRFYAEITRVRQVVELSRGPLPLLFLFDELFHGTNSHDRTAGGEAVLRGLIATGAIGMVTTHDLSLARISDALAPRARNVHFEDRLVDGEMRFDYRMRPGIVEHSNALALMRAIGLDV